MAQLAFPITLGSDPIVRDYLAQIEKQIPPNQDVRTYAMLALIRRTEEEIARVYPSDKIKSPVHLSIGQEGISVGVCEALRTDDVVFGSYRGHALYLAKGGNLKGMIAELYGKETGCGKGKAGSMHLVDVACGMMGTSAVVGTTIPNAVGYAFGMKYLKQDSIVASFFGEGAVEEGVFTESVNFAALRKLPVLFVCENNRYAIHTIQHARQSMDNIVERVRTYGIPAERIENQDPEAIRTLVKPLIERLREGEGPVFIECMTYRWREHVGPGFDWKLGYRSEDEAQPWIRNDALGFAAKRISAEHRSSIDRAVEEKLREAFVFAENSPFPCAEELYTDVFKEA